MAQSTLTHSSASHRHPMIGVRSRVGGIGQNYEVLDIVDGTTALIQLASWAEPLRYAVADIDLDVAGTCNKERFIPLLGQYRSMGPDGPVYEIMGIDSSTQAKIWVVGDEDNRDYEIQDILIDPIVHDGK